MSVEKSLERLLEIAEDWSQTSVPTVPDLSPYFHHQVMNGMAKIWRTDDKRVFVVEQIYAVGVLASFCADDTGEGMIEEEDMEWVFIPWQQVEGITVEARKKTGAK